MTRISNCSSATTSSMNKEVYMNKCKARNCLHHRYLKYGVLFVCVPFMTAAKSYLYLPQCPLTKNASCRSAADLAHYVSTRYSSTSTWDDRPETREADLEAPPLPWQYDAPTATPTERSGPYVKIIPSTTTMSEDESSSEEDFISEQQDPRSRPVVYRFFGRSNRSQSVSADIPFILLGPCADHWKETGKVLAARGYSVMACEEVNDDNSTDDEQQYTHRRGDNLVLAILDALRWKRAVVVGCNENARSAIEAAMRLGPDRVAGLILFGDLTEPEKLLTTEWEVSDKFCFQDKHGRGTLDQFLEDHVDCPSTIVWNGDLKSLATSRNNNDKTPRRHTPSMRTSIVGGGTAPHRRLPDQFAWVLSRFVEEKIAPRIARGTTSITTNNHRNTSLRQLVSPGSLLVTGRVVASTIMYMCAMSVTIYQYKNLKCGLSEFQTNCRQLSVWRKRGLGWVREVLASDTGRKSDFVQKVGSKMMVLRGIMRSRRRKDEPAVVEDREEDVDVPDNDKDDHENDNNNDGRDRPYPSEMFRLFGLDSVIS